MSLRGLHYYQPRQFCWFWFHRVTLCLNASLWVNAAAAVIIMESWCCARCLVTVFFTEWQFANTYETSLPCVNSPWVLVIYVWSRGDGFKNLLVRLLQLYISLDNHSSIGMQTVQRSEEWFRLKYRNYCAKCNEVLELAARLFHCFALHLVPASVTVYQRSRSVCSMQHAPQTGHVAYCEKLLN